jgi:DNA-binding transcriptional regulator LsrR (DeoR family)
MPDLSPAEPADRADVPARPPDLEQAAKALRAAYALCQPGDVTQDVIANQLDVSQSQVSRLLRVARDARWLVDRPIFVPPEPGDAFYELWREVESQFVLSKVLERKFCTHYGPPLRRVVVVDGVGEAFSHGAAQALLSFLEERDRQRGAIGTLGVTWGRNVRYLIQHLRKLAGEPLRPAEDPITLVPLCGEPFQDREDPHTFNSSALAWELHQVVNAPGTQAPLSIAGVYAFIPKKYKRDTETILDFYRLGNAYATIFPKKGPGLAASLDAILTAVGVPGEKYPGVFLRERLALGDLAESEVKWLLGDMSGILFAKKSAPASLIAKIETLNDRWTGVKKSHLEKCAERPGRGPGVTVVAQAEDRAGLIHRCCTEEKVINMLVISRVLAEAIARLVDAKAPAE